MTKRSILAATALFTVLLMASPASAKNQYPGAKAESAPATISNIAPSAQPGMQPGQYAMPPMGAGASAMGSPLAPEKVAMLHNTMRKAHEEAQPYFEKIGAKRTEMQALMVAPKFNKKAYLGKEAEIRGLMDKISMIFAKAKADAAEKLTVDERAKMNGPMGMMMFMGRGGEAGMMPGGPAAAMRPGMDKPCPMMAGPGGAKPAMKDMSCSKMSATGGPMKHKMGKPCPMMEGKAAPAAPMSGAEHQGH